MHFIDFLIITIIIIIILLNTMHVISAINNNQTVISNSFNHILSRKKRFLLYPVGSSILITMQFTKSLVATFPKGINLAAECDLYYELPNKISHYKLPERFKLKSAVHEPEPEPVPIIPMPELPPYHETNIIVSRPPEGAEIITDGHHHDDEGEHGDSDDKRRYDFKSNYFKYQDKSRLPSTFWPQKQSKISDRYYYDKQRQYQSRRTDWGPPLTFYDENKKDKFYKKRSIRNIIENSFMNKEKFINENTNNDNNNIENFKDWEHYHGHKERRDMYEQFKQLSKLIGIHPQTCILRMICEGRHYLLPPGRSLFNDILRILFSVPLHDEFEDDYSKAMLLKPNECIDNYGEKCPISILAFLLSINRGEHNKDSRY